LGPGLRSKQLLGVWVVAEGRFLEAEERLYHGADFSSSSCALRAGGWREFAAAVSTLQKVMVDPSSPAAVKARVAEGFLTLAIKGVETEDILARLDQLEQAAEAR
jgi:hypothetical protein